jgi:hypothetical protein
MTMMPMSLPPSWVDHGLVILAGAGLSIPPPSSVPSWWAFNEQVLDRLKRTVLEGLPLTPQSRTAVSGVTLDDLGSVEFSQVVSDAFAGPSWFRLLSALEGEAPNAGHCALPALAKAGVLRAVVTTNFDTMIDAAFEQAAHHYYPLNPFVDDPPPMHLALGAPVIVKLHGTVDATTSFVDLATQKTVGFSEGWKQWLARTFSGHSLLVVGFSGLDLAIEDFGLAAAAARGPELRWLSRSGETLTPPAKQLIDSYGPRGLVIDGILPDYLEQFAAPSGPTAAASDVALRAGDRIAATLTAWFNKPWVYPMSCATALVFLMDKSKSAGTSALVNDIRRQALSELISNGDSVMTRARVGHALAQTGVYGLMTKSAVAETDLIRAAELELDVVHAADLGQLKPGNIDALVSSATKPVLNLAALRLDQREFPAAAFLTASGRRLATRIGDPRRRDAVLAQACTIDARLALRTARWRDAALTAREGAALARSVGLRDMRLHAEMTWVAALEALGEPELAANVYRHTGAADADFAAHLDNTAGADADTLAARLDREWASDPGRFDEVLFSATALVIGAQARGQGPPLELVRAAKGLLARRDGPSMFLSPMYAWAFASLVDAGAPDDEWLFAGRPRNIEESVISHPDLRPHVEQVVAELADVAGRAIAAGNYGAAADRYLYAGKALQMIGERERGARLMIYSVDAVILDRRLKAAHERLDWLGSFAPASLAPAVVVRRAALLAAAPLNVGERLHTRVAALERLRDAVPNRSPFEDAGIDKALAELYLRNAEPALARAPLERVLEVVRGTADEAAVQALLKSLG